MPSNWHGGTPNHRLGRRVPGARWAAWAEGRASTPACADTARRAGGANQRNTALPGRLTTRRRRSGSAAADSRTGHYEMVTRDGSGAWKLDGADVEIGGSSSSASSRRRRGLTRSSRSEDTRSAIVRLVHRPTGLDAVGEIPAGHYSRDEMRTQRAALTALLWVELEKKVARHFRIPGR